MEDTFIDNIDVPPRLRAVDDAKVKALADSMKSIGLRQPITIWAKPDDAFQLVAGAHRLAAAKMLGWETIAALFMDADDIDRQLWEIDENLMRSELTPTQQAEHLARRKELWEARETAKSSRSFEGRGNSGFASETAAATGASKRSVQQSIARAEGVIEEVRDQIRGTNLDKGVVLDDLRATPPEFQSRRLREIQSDPTIVNRNKIDADIKARAAKEVAEIIAEHVPGEWWDAVKANLYSAGAKNIADEFSNVTGESIMDGRYG